MPCSWPTPGRPVAQQISRAYQKSAGRFGPSGLSGMSRPAISPNTRRATSRLFVAARNRSPACRFSREASETSQSACGPRTAGELQVEILPNGNAPHVGHRGELWLRQEADIAVDHAGGRGSAMNRHFSSDLRTAGSDAKRALARDGSHGGNGREQAGARILGAGRTAIPISTVGIRCGGFRRKTDPVRAM